MSRRRATRSLREAIGLLMGVSRAQTLTLLALSLISAAFYPAILLLVGALLRAVDGGHVSQGHAVTIALALLGLVAIEGAVSIAAQSITAVLRARVTFALTRRLMGKLEQVPYHLFEDNDFQGSYGLVVREACFRASQLVQDLASALTTAIAFVAVAITLLVLAPVLMVLFVVALAMGLVESAYHRRTVDVQTAKAPDLWRMQYLSQMQIDARWQRDLRVYRASVLEEEYEKLGAGYLRRLRSVVGHFVLPRIGAATVSAAVVAGAAWWVVTAVAHGSLSRGAAVVLLPGLYVCLTQARALATRAGHVAESLAYSERLNDFLHTPFQRPAPVPAPARDRAPEIVLRDVCYRYPQRPRPALEAVSLTLRPGVTAIVGPNGAGKSTLVKLLAGLLEPDRGTISLGTAAARAVLFQEPSHLALTVRQSVTMTTERDARAEPAIRRALHQAGLSGVVEALPDGLDTVLGAGFGGTTDLSGGQWQRLALARLLYHEAPLILLDEPVASIDPEGERETFAALRRLAETRIVVFTTHRYDSLAESDRILMLLDGRLAEAGTHGHLLAGRSLYRDLVEQRSAA
jgi:ATP-binding cassette subfamily B protein